MEIGQELSINDDRLYRLNQGYNFLNIDTKKPHKKEDYYIWVWLDVEQNLNETTEKVMVDTNLDVRGSWGNGYELETFFEDINLYSKKLLLNIKKTNNRKNKDNWDRDISHLRDNFRNRTIIFSDVKIGVGKLAERKLKEQGIDFRAKLKKILEQQQETDKKKQKLLDRFVYLKEKVLTLEKFFEKKYSYSYSDEKKDRTYKIMISPEEYNQKLKAIEVEMTAIAKIFNVELNELDYLVIEQKVSYEKWLEVNKEELQEEYEDFGTDETAYADFEEFCGQMYLSSGGVINVG